MESKPYRPSNGTEGFWFDDEFCSKCAKETWNPETDKGRQCGILNRMMLFDIGELQYPSELVYDENNAPTCTAFKLPEPRKKPEPKIPGQITF